MPKIPKEYLQAAAEYLLKNLEYYKSKGDRPVTKFIEDLALEMMIKQDEENDKVVFKVV